MKRLWLVLLVGVAGLVAYLAWRFPDALRSPDDLARVGYLFALLALVSGGVVAGRRLGLRRAVGHALIWSALGLALVAGYGYRAELAGVGERLLGELLPHRGATEGEDAVSFRAGADGHFRIEARVDGQPLRFLVDTGASDIVLSPADARRLGFDTAALAYTRQFDTANGRVRGAPVRLGEVLIGPIRMTDVRATVNQAAMTNSLLGMSFLERLAAYEVRGDRLTLRR